MEMRSTMRTIILIRTAVLKSSNMQGHGQTNCQVKCEVKCEVKCKVKCEVKYAVIPTRCCMEMRRTMTTTIVIRTAVLKSSMICSMGWLWLVRSIK